MTRLFKSDNQYPNNKTTVDYRRVVVGVKNNIECLFAQSWCLHNVTLLRWIFFFPIPEELRRGTARYPIPGTSSQRNILLRVTLHQYTNGTKMEAGMKCTTIGFLRMIEVKTYHLQAHPICFFSVCITISLSLSIYLSIFGG